MLFARAQVVLVTVRDALEMATVGGARVLEDEIGHRLQPGGLADLALWRVDTLAHAGVDDPVVALVLGSPPPLEALLVGGRVVVEADRLVTVDEDAAARDAETAGRTLRARGRVMTTTPRRPRRAPTAASSAPTRRGPTAR